METLHKSYLEACSPAASPDRLRELALDSRARIRARVAENICTPQDLLKQLSSDTSADVRLAVTQNRLVPAALLWMLANDVSPDVRFAIAENPHTTIEVLIWLTGDDNPYVAWRAEETVEIVKNGPNQGGNDMSARKIEHTVRRALNNKERLNKNDALRLKKLVLADGYVSRGERKVLTQALESHLLDDDAFDIFVDVLLHKHNGSDSARQIA